MLFVLQCVLVVTIIIALLVFKGYKAKKELGAPLYCIYLGGDIGQRKPYYLNKDIVTGAPDCVLFNPLTLRFIVCEFKARNYNGHVSDYERAQVTLYMGLINKWYLPQPMGLLSYGNGVTIRIKYNTKMFNQIYRLRHECLKALNRF